VGKLFRKECFIESQMVLTKFVGSNRSTSTTVSGKKYPVKIIPDYAFYRMSSNCITGTFFNRSVKLYNFT
jgi:hypothetical protein